MVLHHESAAVQRSSKDSVDFKQSKVVRFGFRMGWFEVGFM